MVDYCRTKQIDEILQIDDVKERVDLYNEQQIHFKGMLRRCCEVERNVVTTNLLEEEIIYCGNRFIVFASHPDQNIEIRIEPDGDNVSFSCGHSIVNRSSKTNVGKLMYEFGGGGHEAVGACRVPKSDWEKVYERIKTQMLQDG
jgi:nanoRNase/pAp phosphatase (c-di-AMP/oligoRNAs hydrolase)